MIGEPLVIRDHDLAAATDAVRWLFAGPVDTDAAVELLRDTFAEWRGWGDRELVTVLQAALVEH